MWIGRNGNTGLERFNYRLPTRSPTKWVRFGKEEQESGRTALFVTKKNAVAKRTLRPRGPSD